MFSKWILIKGNKTMIEKLENLSTDCMCEDRFWNLVALAKWPCDYDKMKIKYMKLLSKDECKSFRNTLGVAYKMLDTIITSMPLGCSDDGYDDLTHHIIGLGEKEYYKHLNNKKLVQKMADDRNYEENYAYCLPYDEDYSEAGQYSIKSVISIAKSGLKEINRMCKLDKNANHLTPIANELLGLSRKLSMFLEYSDRDGLEKLVEQKEYVVKACKKIQKFFDNNYLELPRKFTEDREDGSNFNGMSTAIFENCIDSAENVLEFLKTDEKELA
jgi:hypothetical protein